MIEVVFGDSAKAVLRMAQHAGSGASAYAVISTTTHRFNGEPVLSEKDSNRIEQFRQKQAERQKNAIPLGGSFEDVVGLSFLLSIGDIAAPLESGACKERIFHWITANPWGEPDEAKKHAEEYWQSCIKDMETLKQRASAGEPVRIWYDHTPDGMCGLHFTVALLNDVNTCVAAVCLPMSWREDENSALQYTTWGEVPPEEIGQYLPFEKEISVEARKALAQRWEQLQEENAPLRAVINGRLQSVDERFYDPFIQKAVPDGNFTVAFLIGAVLGKYQLGISDWWISKRIQAMIEAGELQVVKQDNRFYATVLRRQE